MSNNNGQKLAGKVAVVTGGSRGIGAAIAKRLAADGASVAITYAKDASAASAVVKAIERDGGKAIAIQADAADVEAVKGAVEKTVATFGRLDVLVNNAGTAIPKMFETTTLEEIDRVIDVNVRGTLAATQAALKHMKSGGRIIMTGSAVGERGHHGQQRPAGSDRHRFESRGGRLGGASEGRHGARPLWTRRRSCRVGGVRRRAGVLVHHGIESDRRWRNECLSQHQYAH